MKTLAIVLLLPAVAFADAASATAVRNAASSAYSTATANSSATAVAITGYLASNRGNTLKIAAISSASRNLMRAFDASKPVQGTLAIGDGLFAAGEYDKAEQTYVAALKSAQAFLQFDVLARQLYALALKTAADIDAGLYDGF